VARARPFAHQRDPPLASLSQTSRANIDALERENDALKRRVAVLEARDSYFRLSFYPYIVGLAAAVPFAAPPALPD
jgi:hypothetical protein